MREAKDGPSKGVNMHPSGLGTRVSRWSAVIVSTVIFLLSTAMGQATPSSVTLEVVPQNVTIISDRPAEARLLLNNNGDVPLSDIELTWFSDSPLSVDFLTPSMGTLSPGGTLAILVTIKNSAGKPAEGAVHFQISYTWLDESANQVENTLLATLQVTGHQPQLASEKVQAEVLSSGATANEKRPIPLYLMLTNTSSEPVTINQISPSGPAFMEFDPGQLKVPFSIEGGQTLSIPFTATPSNAIIAGDHLLFFDVAMTWQNAGQTINSNTILSTKVTVESFGEPEMLKVLGVPSFYILPGFLMVVTVGLLWRVSKIGREFPLSITSPEFWLVAITLSIGIASIYPLVTGRDYLTGYDLRDVVQIWLSSIILAAGAFVVIVGGANLVRRYLEWRRRRHLAWLLPNSNDKPVELLHKLHRQNLGVFLERAELDIQGQTHLAYVYQEQPETWENICVGPAIVVEWLQGADVTLRQKVSEQLEERGSALKLAELLVQGQQQGDLRIYYRGSLDRPTLVGKDEIKSFLPANIVVEEE